MELTEQLKEIKTQLRLSMNGAVSQSMREKGLVYKLNFGVELPRMPLTRKTTLWRRHFGKKIFANVKYWRDCSSRLTVSCPKLRIYGWRTSGILRLRSSLV